MKMKMIGMHNLLVPKELRGKLLPIIERQKKYKNISNFKRKGEKYDFQKGRGGCEYDFRLKIK